MSDNKSKSKSKHSSGKSGGNAKAAALQKFLMALKAQQLAGAQPGLGAPPVPGGPAGGAPPMAMQPGPSVGMGQ